MLKKQQFALRILIVSILIIIIYAIILNNLLSYSFWIDEGYSASVVRDEMRDPNTIREALRFVRDSLVNTFEHIQTDVHPPLYYLLLDGWTMLIGHSEFALRVPSAILATISLASIYALGRQWFTVRTGIIALIVLGTSGFYLYYAREARMYSLYLALATLSTWAYTLWWHRPSIRRGLLYGLILDFLLYTHYTSFTIIVVHLIHALTTLKIWSGKASLWQIFIPFGIVILLLVPWLPFLVQQIEINTGFSAPGAIASDWVTVAAIWLKLTSGYWGIFALVFILSRAMFRVREKSSALYMILLWGFVPIGILFGVNAQGLSLLQLRYLIPIIGAWSLLIAYLLSEMWIPLVKNQRVGLILTLFFTTWIAYTQLATYHIHWVAKPDWRRSANNAIDERQPLEPAFVYLADHSPLTYYAQQTGLLDGISLDIQWRDLSPQEVRELSNQVDNANIVWAFMEMQAPSSWDAVMELSESRGISYRDSVQGTILYAFDTASDETFSFTFGTTGDNQLFAYRGELNRQFTPDAEGEVCVPIVLETLDEIDENYRLSVHLTRGYNEVVAQSELDLRTYTVGDIIEEVICMTKPNNETYHLRLLIYPQQSALPLYVMESNLLWGNQLIIGVVE